MNTITPKCEEVASSIDELASIHPSAQIGNHVVIGPYAIIGPNVEIGDYCQIAAHAVIASNTKMQSHNKVFSFAAVGSDPQDASYQGEETFLEMGSHNIIREYVTISRGSANSNSSSVTHIGDHNSFFACAHVAHDATIGSHVLFTNNAVIAGHVTVDDHAIIGAFTAVHQFCRIGAYSFLCRGTQVGKDVPPYMMVTGIPGFACGLNMVGLKRNGFSLQTVRGLKKAYQILYRNGLSLQDAVNQLQALVMETPEIQLILDLITSSKRGIERKNIEG